MVGEKTIKQAPKELKEQTLIVKELPMVPQREIIDEEQGIRWKIMTTEEALTELFNK